MSQSEMSERKSLICKRNTELEGSSIKRMRLDDDSADADVLRSLARMVSSSSSSSLAYSSSESGGFSAALSEENDHRSSSISSESSSSETNETATNTRLPFLDLQSHGHQVSETEISTLITNNFRKRGGPLSKILGETAEMDSATTERRDQQTPGKKTGKYPTQAELDEFFSETERFEQKRFTKKYNYDIVNDTPLEGRYQWVSLKPLKP